MPRKYSLVRGELTTPSFRRKPESSPLMLDPGFRRGDDWCLSSVWVNMYLAPIARFLGRVRETLLHTKKGFPQISMPFAIITTRAGCSIPSDRMP